MVAMYFSPADLDKAFQKKTARHAPLRSGRRFLRSFSGYFQDHLLSCMLAGLLLLGILTGTLMVNHCSERTLDILKVVLGNYVEQRKVQTFLNMTVSTFFSLFSSLLILFFCGFCTISQLVILMIPFLKGLGYGFSVGTLYAEYGKGAIPYVSALMLPVMALGAMLLISSSRSSLRLSVSLLHTTMNSSEQSERARIQRYCIRYLLFTGICLGISILDAILYLKLSGLFVLGA